jgi:hypothetical protein
MSNFFSVFLTDRRIISLPRTSVSLMMGIISQVGNLSSYAIISSSKGYLYTRTGDWYFCTMARPLLPPLSPPLLPPLSPPPLSPPLLPPLPGLFPGAHCRRSL